ncbi:MAG: hypothetical protein U5L45_09950 [Saprospiraceae bacterium]|nr:hypothetical protein [Saprospiraceae bacterium]
MKIAFYNSAFLVSAVSNFAHYSLRSQKRRGVSFFGLYPKNETHSPQASNTPRELLSSILSHDPCSRVFQS